MSRNRRFFILILSLGLMLLARPALAEDSGWFWQNPFPQGNGLSGTAMVGANTIYAVGANGTLMRSIDAGVHWTIQTIDTRAGLYDVSCSDVNTCIAVGESGTIVRTSDGGGNWSIQTVGTSGLGDISCTNANTCTAVGGGTILRTTDGGASWTPQSSPTNGINDVACADANTCTAVGAWGKIVRTTDAGVTWGIQSSGTPTDQYGVSYTHLSGVSCPDANTCTAVGNQVGNPGWILRTTNGGATWTTQSSGFGSDRASEELYDVFCPDASNCTAVGYSIIMGTTDGGATWTRQQVSDTNNIFVGLHIVSVRVSCADANTCTAVGPSGTIVRTTDGGVTWIVQTPTSAATFSYLLGVSCADANTCTAVGAFGAIVRSADGGATWAAQSSRSDTVLRGVSCPDANTCTAVGDFRPIDGGASVILRTTNGGATWTPQASGMTGRLRGVSCPDAFTCTAVGGRDDATSPWGTRATILRTTDAGATWTLQSPSQDPNDPVPELFGVSFTDANTGTAVGAHGTILRTYQGGEDWSPQQPNTNQTVYSVSMTDVDTGMAVADRNILRASPPGALWTPVSGDTALGVSCTDANTCTAMGAGDLILTDGGDILQTTDGGATWTHRPNPSGIKLFSVSCTGADKCTAVGGNGTILGWAKSPSSPPPTVDAPRITPPGGTYTEPVSAEMSTTTSGATMYYTTDGTTPTTLSTLYTGPIAVTETTTIQAIATASRMLDSRVSSATFTLQAATPTFSPPDGTYDEPQSVALGTTTSSATMYYTTDGSTPTTSSTIYAGPIAVTETMTIQAMAAASGMIDSEVSAATYTLRAAAPAYDPPGRSYLLPQWVSISDASPGTTIYYTTNGSMPSISSTRYTGPILVLRKTTIRAIAVGAGWSQSPMTTATYRMLLPR